MYEKIHNSGVAAEQKVKLLGTDSKLSQFIDKEENLKLLADYHATHGGECTISELDYTKLSLPLIKKSIDVINNEKSLQPRNYNKLSNVQKVIAACTLILAPLTSKVMKEWNKVKGTKISFAVKQNIETINKELNSLNPNKKEFDPMIEVDQIAKKCNLGSFAAKVKNSRKNSIPLAKDNSSRSL
ncbi:MAG: hypothetical protein HRU35_05770 [Rickettsiaceae bacterium]|nr:hypothetical protein [Rickettsiaceae bacterium]